MTIRFHLGCAKRTVQNFAVFGRMTDEQIRAIQGVVSHMEAAEEAAIKIEKGLSDLKRDLEIVRLIEQIMAIIGKAG